MKLVIILIIIFSMNGMTAVGVKKKAPTPSSMNCNFYQDFMPELKCDASEEYLKSYGAKYCGHFLKNRKEKGWSPQLKKWAEETSLCLQEMLKQNPKRINNECYQLNEFAFDTHPICYKQYKVCELSIADKINIIKILSLQDLISNSRNSLVQAMNTGLSCLSVESNFPRLGEIFLFKMLASKDELKPREVRVVEEIFSLIPSDYDKAEVFFKAIAPDFMFKDKRKDVEKYLPYYDVSYEKQLYDGVRSKEEWQMDESFMPFPDVTVGQDGKMHPVKGDLKLIREANEQYKSSFSEKDLLLMLEKAKAALK